MTRQHITGGLILLSDAPLGRLSDLVIENGWITDILAPRTSIFRRAQMNVGIWGCCLTPFPGRADGAITAELVRKGCTAAYDLFAEFPAPRPRA